MSTVTAVDRQRYADLRDSSFKRSEVGDAEFQELGKRIKADELQERRQDSALTQELAGLQSRGEAMLATTFQAMEHYVQAREELNRVRTGIATLERQARKRRLLTRTFATIERELFDSQRWREAHEKFKTVVGGKAL